MTEWPDIRRLDSGAIDYDFYRARAHALREQAIREAVRPRSPAGLKPMTVALIAIGALALFASVGRP